MTRFVFVRHGENEIIRTRIAGRSLEVHLNERGRAQAREVAEALTPVAVDAVFSGPLERARETAQPLCATKQLPLGIAEEFTEIDFAGWTGGAFEDLRQETQFRTWNLFRSFSAPPGGEMMLEVQARVVRKLYELREQHRSVVIFTHGDVIRATVAFALGVPLDLFQRIQIDSASISAFDLGDDWLRVLVVNGGSDAVRRLA